MTIASAAHPAALLLPIPGPLHLLEEDDRGSGAQFARQLRGFTETPEQAPAEPAGDTASRPQPAAGAPVLVLPQPAAAQTAALLPAPITESQLAASASPVNLSKATSRPAPTPALRSAPSTGAKRQAPNQTAAPKTSSESVQTAPVAVTPVPTPEIAANVESAETSNNDDAASPVKAALPRNPAGEASEPPPPITTTAAEPAPTTLETAFAARVQPAERTDTSALPAEMASASAVASANKKVTAAADDAEALPADTRAVVAAAAGAAVGRNLEPASTPAPAAHAATAAHRAEAPLSPAESLPKSAAPLKDISLQVNQAGKERVDVRVVQQGSEVRVSVHSGDAGLTSGLRQGLSELQNRLEETGYRSEIWRPGVAAAPVAAANSTQASGNQARGGDSQPQQGGSQQQESGRRNQHQSNPPRWLEEMESTLNGGQKSTGGFYGFSS